MFKDKTRGRSLSLLSAFVAVISSFMAAPYIQTPFGHIQDASAQNNTTATNQTAGATGNQTMQNQTAGPFGNLTRAALDPVNDLMEEARESLHTNDTSGAYVRLNRADSSLFAILNEQNARIEQFQPVKSAIDDAKDALTQDDNAKALEGLNSAGVALLGITQQLPAGESVVEGEATEDEGEATEDEGEATEEESE